MLKGLPDFSQIIEGEDFIAFAPYQDGTAITVIPKGMKVAQSMNGQLAFQLESVRPSNPFSPVEAHGFLFMGLAIEEISEPMLTQVRAKWSNKAIQQPHFYQGFIRLMANAEGFFEETIKKEFAKITNLDGLPVSRIRFAKQLSDQAITTIKNALQEEFLLVDAYAELSLQGLAPRLSTTIEFDPATLLEHLQKLANEDGLITISKLINYLAENLSSVPVKFITKDHSIQPKELAITFTDWISSKFGTFVPAPLSLLEPHIRLQEPGERGGTFQWDFSDPLVTTRSFSFQFDAFDLARKLVATKGIDRVFKETTIRPINTGFFRLVITHLFKTLPENVRKIGIKIHVPKNPGFRYRAINETVYLDSAEDISTIELKFSPKEEKIYTYQPFVVLKSSTGVREIKGDIITATAPVIHLGFNDFPISLIPIEVTPTILANATIEGSWQWYENNKKLTTDFELTTEQPNQVIGLPKTEFATSSGHFKAMAKSFNKEIELAVPATNSFKLSRLSFPEYGSHTIDIQCNFEENEPFYILELLPEDKTATAENITTFSFTPTQPQRSWTWFANSIFQPGFRYRVHKGSIQEALAWSEIQSPFKGILAIGNPKDKNEQLMELEKIEGDKAFEDLLYYKSSAQEGLWYYLPIRPRPKTDQNNRPSVSLIIIGDKGILQISSEWAANQNSLELLRKRIATTNGTTAASIQLAFAPIKIEKAELIIAKDNHHVVLADSNTSGFPPYSTIFNAELTKDQQDQVIAAFHEQANNLLVRYHATRNIDATISIQIAGDITSSKVFLPPEASLTACKEWVQQAIEEAILSNTQIAATSLATSLKQSAEQAALEAAANYVQRFIQEQPLPNESALSIEVIKGEEKPLSFYVTTDISTWFSGIEGDDFIKFF